MISGFDKSRQLQMVPWERDWVNQIIYDMFQKIISLFHNFFVSIFEIVLAPDSIIIKLIKKVCESFFSKKRDVSCFFLTHPKNWIIIIIIMINLTYESEIFLPKIWLSWIFFSSIQCENPTF